MSTKIMQRLGVYGWDSIESIVVAAMLLRHPVLFVGRHGVNKTEGVKILVHALLGRDAKFQKYDVPLLSVSDFMGYPDPKSTGGELKFIHTPISVWGKSAVSFDEINADNMLAAHKILEFVREGTVMGFEIPELEWVCATCNPPGTYQTAYMTPQTISRFIVVEVPDSFDREDMNKILSGGNRHNRKELKTIGRLLQELGDRNIDESTEQAVAKACLDIYDESKKPEKFIYISPRDLKKLQDLLCVMLNNQDKIPITHVELVHAVEGCIPEFSQMHRTHVPLTGHALHNDIVRIVRSLMADSQWKRKNLIIQLKQTDRDASDWLTNVLSSINVEGSTRVLIKAYHICSRMRKRAAVDKELPFGDMARRAQSALVLRYLTISDKYDNMPFGHLVQSMRSGLPEFERGYEPQ